MAHEPNTASHAKALPANLGAPAFVDAWKMRALVVGAVFAVIAVILAFLGQAQDGLGWEHALRAWTLGTMWTWGLTRTSMGSWTSRECSGPCARVSSASKSQLSSSAAANGSAIGTSPTGVRHAPALNTAYGLPTP